MTMYELKLYVVGRTPKSIDVIEELVGRLCLVAESRSWMAEILQMGREAWKQQQSETDPLHRPNFRYTEGAGGD